MLKNVSIWAFVISLCLMNQACGKKVTAQIQTSSSSSSFNDESNVSNEEVENDSNNPENTIVTPPSDSRNPTGEENNDNSPTTTPPRQPDPKPDISEPSVPIPSCTDKKLNTSEVPLGFKKVTQRLSNGCVEERVTPNFCNPSILPSAGFSGNQKPACSAGEIARIFVYINKRIEFEPNRFGVIQVKPGSRNNLPYNDRYDFYIEPTAENTCLVYSQSCVDEDTAFTAGYYQKAASSLFVEDGESYDYKCSDPRIINGLEDWNFRWQSPEGESAMRDGESAYLCNTFRD